MTRGQRLFVVLNALFVGFLLLAELTGSKLFQLPVAGVPPFPWLGIDAFTMTAGVIPFPLTFLITDLLNEYYGRRGVRFTTLLGMIAVILAYGILFLCIQIPAWEKSPVSDEAFRNVFANSTAIIVGSVIAYLIGQLIDIQVFHFLRNKTGNRHIWLRATGSTVVSQFIDSFVVIFIAFGSGLGTTVLPAADCFEISMTNWVYKLLIAVLLTPLIYLAHGWIDRHLGREGEALRERALRDQAFTITVYPG